jgi:hypothetical protein
MSGHVNIFTIFICTLFSNFDMEPGVCYSESDDESTGKSTAFFPEL